MFDASILLSLKSIFLNLVIPIIPWIIFLWLFFSNKFKWINLYIISFFIWTGFLSSTLFNLWFVHFGLWIKEYFYINATILFLFILKIFYLKEKVSKYTKTLILWKFNFKIRSKNINKNIIYTMLVFIWLFLLISFLYNINFPNYAIDSFFNWNRPIINLFYDDWIYYFWDKILWWWFLGYPIHIPIYKALVSNFFWSYNDIYINIWNYLIFIFFIIFLYNNIFSKTKDTFFSLLPIVLIIWMPLIFFHLVEWLLDLACAIYSFFTIYFLKEFIEKGRSADLSIWLLFWFILSNIKNEWLIIYFSSIIFIFLLNIILKKKIKKLYKDKMELFKIIFFILYFLFPFILLKINLWLWYNQAAWTDSWTWISAIFHFETIYNLLVIFFYSDNFNLSLIFIFFILISLFRTKKIFYKYNFGIFSWFLILFLFILVFLIGDNYEFFFFTANRLYSMTFIIIFSFWAELLCLFYNKIND